MALSLDPAKTALVLIDLQMGILSMPLQPHDLDKVVANGVALAKAVGAGGGMVVRVNVAFAPDFSDRPQGVADVVVTAPPGGAPPEYSQFHPDVAALDALTVTKRQWGAFHGTAMDDLFRRRRIETVIVCGVATNFGVEQTVREGWQNGYSMIVAEDASTSNAEGLHAFSIERILPRISRVRSTADIVAALGAGA